MEIFGKDDRTKQERVQELLRLVGLEDKSQVFPALLSGGQKQRVGIARALANHPEILLCDEATSALDPKTTRSILKLLVKLNQELGLTIILITHQIEVIKEVCGRVGVLSDGELIEEGETRQVFGNPRHPVTHHLLYHEEDLLPEGILKEKGPGVRLLRLHFEGEGAEKPVISSLIRQVDVEVNILLGSLDCIQNTIMGNLLVEISGKEEEIKKALQFLKDQNVRSEVLR